MAPNGAARGLRLWVAGLCGQPAGNELQLIEETRKCLNPSVPGGDSPSVQSALFLHGMELLMRGLLASLGGATVHGLSRHDLGETVFEGVKLITSRTRLMLKYSVVLDDASVWARVEAGLADLAREGASLCGRAAW